MNDQFADLRIASGLSIDDLARDLGTSPSEVAAWDAGLATPPAQVIRSLEVMSAFGDTFRSNGGRPSATNAAPYASEVSAVHRKRLGQVFTPESVAALMADWVIRPNTRTVLDPALGTGNLARAILERRSDIKFTGIEIDSVILGYVAREIRNNIEIINADALTWNDGRRFDGIVMNPPYIRHRELKNHDHVRQCVANRSGVPIPKSANLYVDFVLQACSLLNEGGRGAFLIPAEWMSANFSARLKDHLLESGLLRTLVTFSHCSQVFDGALTTASVLLVEKGRPADFVESHFLQSVSAQRAPTNLDALKRLFPARTISVSELKHAAKWEPFLKGERYEAPEGWATLGELATTRRGIATGSNSFFLISEERLRLLRIQDEHAKACIGRANDVRGLIFDTADFEDLRRSGANVWLLDFTKNLNDAEVAYIADHEAKGLNARYLLKNRTPWYSMEKRAPSPVWAGVFGRGDLRFVYNAARVRSLTNFHCVFPTFDSETMHKALVVLLNCREVRDLMAAHRRGYGGGLGKFEPNDLKTIPVPDIRYAPVELITEISSKLRSMDEDARSMGPSRELGALIEEVQSAVKEAKATR